MVIETNMQFNVYIKGLGGAMNEFSEVRYSVSADSWDAAVAKATESFNEEFGPEKFGENPFNIIALTIRKSIDRIL